MEDVAKVAGLTLWASGYGLGIARGVRFRGPFVDLDGWPLRFAKRALATFAFPFTLVIVGALLLATIDWEYIELILMAIFFSGTIGQLFEVTSGRIVRFLRVPILAILAMIGVLTVLLVWDNRFL